MATVRIYKVAELLNTSSQEVLALLKRAHGIELKSASSTIEEVVARQFVDRLARERNITLPGGDIFAEGPASSPRQKAGLQRRSGAAKPPRDARTAAARQNVEARRPCRRIDAIETLSGEAHLRRPKSRRKCRARLCSRRRYGGQAGDRSVAEEPAAPAQVARCRGARRSRPNRWRPHG